MLLTMAFLLFKLDTLMGLTIKDDIGATLVRSIESFRLKFIDIYLDRCPGPNRNGFAGMSQSKRVNTHFVSY